MANPSTESDPAPTGREAPAWLALLVFLVCAFVPLREALLDPSGRALLAVDTVTSQLPWSAHLAEQGIEPDVANAELSDQGTVFHPYYRWVVRSWLAGDPPLWNPHVYLGAPALGNPQAGVLDPQVLVLVLFEWLAGEPGFALGLALTAWLRLGLGAFGAFLLARRLGLFGSAPWLAGFAFGFCGFTVLWLNHPLGHVPVFLPWLLLGVEAIARARRGGGSAVVPFALLALTSAACVLAGHPETSFYVCAFVGLWCLVLARTQRAAGLLAAAGLVLGACFAGPMLVPFLEYLGDSAATAVREGQRSTFADIDLVGLFAAVAVVATWFATGVRRFGGLFERRATLRAGLRIGALVLGALVLGFRGLPEGAVLAFVPGLFGRPDEAGGYLGPGSYLEEASLFAPLAIAALALASIARGSGPLRGRGVLIVGTALAWWLAQRAPGLLELKQQIPKIGLGATVRLAPVAALGIALLAAEGWQVSKRSGRVLGMVGVLALALVVGPVSQWARSTAPPPAPSVTALETAGLVVVPQERTSARRIELEGWYDPERVQRVGVRFVPQRIDAVAMGGSGTSLDLFDAPSAAARARLSAGDVRVPDDVAERARWFRSIYLDTSRLSPGWWTIELALEDRSGAVEHVPVTRIDVVRPVRFSSGFLFGLALWAVLPFAFQRWARILVVGGIAVRLVGFAEGLNPAIDARRVFPETATEKVLADAPSGTRFMGGPGVMPPNSAMVRGLYSLRGYDGLEPLGYFNFVPYVLLPGVHPILGWNARGVDVSSPLFRLTGVQRLALAEPFAAPGWTLVAGPDAGAPRFAEVHVYAADEPLPRAFCVPRVIGLDDLVSLVRSGTGFDPRAVASINGDWRPRTPMQRAEVGAPRSTNTTVEVDVALDGDGLLVLTDMMFAGWEAEVDGERRELEYAYAVFRGLPLTAGEHRVRFVYRPASLRAGAALAGVAFGLALLVGLLAARTRRSGGREARP
jgi:hypothetical protein